MRLEIIDGYYLTATQRRGIVAILRTGLPGGQIGRTVYRVRREGRTVQATIEWNEHIAHVPPGGVRKNFHGLAEHALLCKDIHAVLERANGR